jgi:hypothetical protein
MEMFLDHADHSRFLFDRVAQKPKHVFIASFGIYAGISYKGQDTTEWGDKYRLATRDLMESMRGLPDVRFLIGAANFKSCKHPIDCVDCEKQYCRTLIRLVNHADKFPEFQWRVTTELHLKCALFFYDKSARGVAGGRNFADSDWSDCTFELPVGHIKQLYEHVNGLWDQARVINNETIGQIFDEEQISERGFQATVAGVQEDDEIPF